MARSDRSVSTKVKRNITQLRFSIAALVLAAVILLIGALFLNANSQDGNLKTVGAYGTVQPVQCSYSSVLECEGRMEPIHISDIHASGNGVVTSVLVKDGDHVYQDVPLFIIEDENGSKSSVDADISGTITNSHVKEGMRTDEIAAQGYAMQIADMNVLVGQVTVNESAAPYIVVGEEAQVTISGKEKDLDAMIIDLSSEPTQDPGQNAVSQITATLLLDDSSDLEMGRQIVAHIPINDYGQVFYVPASAVAEENDRPYIEVMRGKSIFEQHQVELLGTDDNGDKIIKCAALTQDSRVRADLSE